MSPAIPDWEYWGLISIIPIRELCALALNVEPSRSDVILEEFYNSKYENDLFIYIENREQAELYEKRYRKILSIVTLNLKTNGGKTGWHLVDSRPSEIAENKIKVKDFVKLINKSTIPLPDNFPKYRNSRDDSKLSKSEKSKLTQENNQLKKMFKELVKHHYSNGVSAYEISKDIATSEATIRKYLK